MQVLWWKSGLIPPLGTYQKGYWMDPFSLFWVEVILVQFAELKRCELAPPTCYEYPCTGSGWQGSDRFLSCLLVLNTHCVLQAICALASANSLTGTDSTQKC